MMINFERMTVEERQAYREEVAVLNDQMRAKLDGPAPNIVVMTSGILALVDADAETAVIKQGELMALVANYEFNDSNDSTGERDFGRFEWQSVICYWKVDYYDREIDMGSADPSNPDITCRVLTILRADEY